MLVRARTGRPLQPPNETTVGLQPNVSRFGLAMGIDVIAEYVTGFAFGLLIFQALFMKDMLGAEVIRWWCAGPCSPNGCP